MSNNKLVGILLAAIVVAAGALFVGQRAAPTPARRSTGAPSAPTPSPAPPALPEAAGDTAGNEETDQPVAAKPTDLAIIEMRESGFTPNTLTIRKGEAVLFVNNGSVPMWPASGVHPTHQLCPGFDALGGVPSGGSYTHTFSEAKVCPFHDHLNPSLRGRITVTE
jgi:plastocyanin